MAALYPLSGSDETAITVVSSDSNISAGWFNIHVVKDLAGLVMVGFDDGFH